MSMRQIYVGKSKDFAKQSMLNFSFVAFTDENLYKEQLPEVVKNLYDGRIGFMDKEFVALYVKKIMDYYL